MKSYTTTRLPFTEKRKTVWVEICRYLNRHYISKDSAILELGCGYGDLIGNIAAKEKMAVEIDEAFVEYVKSYKDVHLHLGDVMDVLPRLEKERFDVVLCSNHFEHFSMEDVQSQLELIRGVLKEGGKLIIIQPISNCALHPISTIGRTRLSFRTNLCPTFSKSVVSTSSTARRIYPLFAKIKVARKQKPGAPVFEFTHQAVCRPVHDSCL